VRDLIHEASTAIGGGQDESTTFIALLGTAALPASLAQGVKILITPLTRTAVVIA
jgi:hypothetical protein